jgi:integrase
MYFKHGRYYHVVKGKWIPLSKDYTEALTQYARRNESGSGIASMLDRTLELSTVKASTMKQYLGITDVIKKAFAEFEPNQVKPMHIAQFLDHHAKTPSMSNRMRSVLKISFDKGVQWGLCESNPVSSISPIKEKPRERYLTDDEYLKIRSHARNYLALMMDLAYLTGQRVNDIILLKQSDIRDGEIYFEQQKTGQKMTVETNEAIEAAIKAARAIHRVGGMTLFHIGNGKPYSYFTVRDAFRIAREKAKVLDAQFRDIRAKSATDAEEEGLNPGILLGHSSPQTTKRYLRKKRIMRAVGPQSIRQK